MTKKLRCRTVEKKVSLIMQLMNSREGGKPDHAVDDRKRYKNSPSVLYRIAKEDKRY